MVFFCVPALVNGIGPDFDMLSLRISRFGIRRLRWVASLIPRARCSPRTRSVSETRNGRRRWCTVDHCHLGPGPEFDDLFDTTHVQLGAEPGGNNSGITIYLEASSSFAVKPLSGFLIITRDLFDRSSLNMVLDEMPPQFFSFLWIAKSIRQLHRSQLKDMLGEGKERNM